MRKTRFMSYCFLAFSVAFLFVPYFRSGLRSTALVVLALDGAGRYWAFSEIEPARLRARVVEALEKRDARTLAVGALFLPHADERARAAEQAIAIDPQYTWVASKVINADRNQPGALDWIQRLETWDPANAYPKLEHAGHLLENAKITMVLNDENLNRLAGLAEWRQLMEEAFAAKRFDTYSQRRFEMERAWLSEHNSATPDVVVLSVFSYPIPNLLNIRTYAVLRVKKFGREAEEAGRLNEALGHYWAVAHFGQRMRLDGRSVLEQMIGSAVMETAGERLVPALRKAGRADEALQFENTIALIHRERDRLRGKVYFEQTANAGWNAWLVHVSGALVVLFAAITLLFVLYVNLKRWVRRDKKGKVYNAVTVAENYVPILLFLSCAGFYMAYYPYALNFEHYMTAQGVIYDFEPLLANSIPLIGAFIGQGQLPLGNPFVPYVWYALIVLVAVVVGHLIARRRTA